MKQLRYWSSHFLWFSDQKEFLYFFVMNFLTCIVFPSPISSPRMQPWPLLKQHFIHETPSSWYLRKWMPCNPSSSKLFWDRLTSISIFLWRSSFNFFVIVNMIIIFPRCVLGWQYKKQPGVFRRAPWKTSASMWDPIIPCGENLI